MTFWTYVLYWVISFVAAELLRPKPDFDDPDRAGLSDFNFPTAGEGRLIPVIYGKVQQAAPNVVWYGDLNVVARKKKVKTGLFSSDKITTHYDYYVSMHLVLGMGEDLVVDRIWLDDTEIHTGGENSTLWQGSMMIGTDDPEAEINSDGSLLKVNNQNFGAQAWIMPGGTSPIKYPLITNFIGSELANLLYDTKVDNTNGFPLWRGTTGIFMQRAFVGRSPNMRPLKFEVYQSAAFNGAKPIDILLDIMTNTNYGMAKSLTLFDAASYTTASATLDGEGFLMSYHITHQSKFENIVEDILTHIDAVQFVSPSTGLFTIKLVRNDYSEGALDEFGVSNILSLLSYSRGSWENTTNEVKVKYISRENNYTDGVAISQDMASWKSQNHELVAVTQLFSGIYDADLAAKVAQRGLNNLSKTLARVELETNRLSYELSPGSVFKFAWEPLGITQMVLRVVSIDYGTLQNGAIRIVCAEDVFSLKDSLYADPPASGWVPESTLPVVSPDETLIEAPYYFVSGDSTFGGDFTQGKYVSLARTITAGLGFDTYSKMAADPVGDYSLSEEGSTFIPHGLVSTAVVKKDLSVTIKLIDNISELEDIPVSQLINGKSFMLVGDEFMEYTTITDNGDGTHTFEGTFWRGLADTVPGEHAVDSEVWFIGYIADYTNNVYQETDQVNARILPFTNNGTLALADASDLSLTMAARAHRPYPPANFQVNSLYYPTANQDSDITLDWAHRDRTVSPTLMVDHRDNTDIGPEASTTYTLRIYGETSNLLRTEVGITANTYLYDLATEVADSWPAQTGRRNETLSFELESVRAGYTSTKFLAHTVNRTPIAGYGADYGENYGGA